MDLANFLSVVLPTNDILIVFPSLVFQNLNYSHMCEKEMKYKTVPTFNCFDWMLPVYKPGKRCQLTKLFKTMDSGEFPEACGERILCLRKEMLTIQLIIREFL